MSGHLRRKNLKKGVSFTLAIVGANGLGKATFINTLCGQDIVLQREVPPADSCHAERPMMLTAIPVELEEDGVRMSLSIIDTPGFDDKLNVESNFQEIQRYVEHQFDEALLEETRIKRNPKFQDNRVHCMLYFIAPTGHSLSDVDLEFMRRLAPLVNVIPVIAKADSLTLEEMRLFKKRIMAELVEEKVPIFDFPYDPEADDEDTIQENRELRAKLPFSVIGADGIYSVNGKKVRGRQYPWGVSEVDNEKHCDFGTLRNTLFSTHLQDLKDSTEDDLYETYRTQKLSMEENSMNKDKSEEMQGSQEMREEVVKQVLLKEELLRKESERLKDKEMKVQRDIDLKRRDLLRKEQSLKEMETRIGGSSSGQEM